jgi:hypothetical protein
MDPITAICRVIEALTKLVTVIVEGQTPEQKKIFWDWWIEDMKFWRDLLKKLTNQP